MNIGLIDVDGHNFPNLALMKISAYHKKQGDTVEMILPFNKYDKVYMSKTFTFTQDFETSINAKEIIKGGTGYDLTTRLHPEIEHIYPDYSLYPQYKNTAYGFLTRGCFRNCDFCIVSKKEGKKSIKVADLTEFWKGQKEIKLLDPNLLACKDRVDLLKQLVDSNDYIDFTQGLDIRLMNEELAELIMQCKIKMLHFAWDTDEESELIIKNLKRFKETTNINYRKARVYVLINFGTSHQFDLFRIYQLKEMGYDPYVMIYEKETASIQQKRLARWVNNKFIFRACEKFEDYKP